MFFTQREDIDASMEDGILTLKIPCGPPASLDAEDVSIR
jgi:HSP20 family molecular chaperone IbpA